MVAQSNHEPISVEEYLAIEQADLIKHEYVDGRLYAMSGGTVAHDRIANNVRSSIDGQLGAGPCSLHGPDIQLRVSPTVYYYPDVIVACDETIEDDALAITAPRLIVEVLSDSTEATDRGRKFLHYQTLPSFQEYLLVDSRQQLVERYSRADDERWTYQQYATDTTLILQTIGLSLPVAAFYRGTRV